MEETFRIGRASFVGGVVCVAIAMLVVPSYWLLGLLGGIAGGFLSGYITFDFSEVRRKVPEALHRAKTDTSQAFLEIASAVGSVVKEWASKPHPFLPIMLVLIGLYLWSVSSLVDNVEAFSAKKGESFSYSDATALIVMWAFITIIFPMLAFIGLAWTGAQKVDGVYWAGFPHDIYDNYLSEKGLRLVSLTYLNLYLFVIKGLAYWIFQTAMFLCWRIWKYPVIGLYFAGRFIARFFWHLFKLVHSQQRLLCGVHGTLGGLISLAGFYLYGPATPTTVEYLTIALFGGLIGAALGIASWELISKHVFGYGVKSA